MTKKNTTFSEETCLFSKSGNNTHVINYTQVKMADGLNSRDTFAYAIKKAFNYWSVLQISREHGFGGRNSFEKEEWLYDSVLQIFTENDVVFPDELEDFISEAIFNEFDTVVEDGTLNVLCKQLCGFYDMCVNQQYQQVHEELNKLGSLARRAPAVIAVCNESDESEEEINSQIFEGIPNGNELISENNTQQEQDIEMETDEDKEWKVVRRSKR
ncbi:pre-rRNA-processing protein TSR2 homolog isoform X3 [Hydra vulgaris]|uniref:Pre-rRNA-processing protein TSR2 homolog n=1 Tax=Hydra vulgaris TaxID=6087 RepID=A0ABM4D8Q2_HYDVU